MGWFSDAWHSVVDSNPITAGISDAIHTVGESTGVNDVVDTVAPYAALAAALAAGGYYLAPELLAGAEAGAGGVAGGTVAGDAFLPGALGTEGLTGGAVAGGEGAVGGTVGADGFYGLGNGTSYAQGATTDLLSPYYGTAQASPTSLGLVSGGGGSTIGEGSIIGSGMGLGQTVPANVLNVANSLNMPKIPSQNSTPQKSMANALRLPTDLNTNVAVYKQENPFYYSPQQQLANMLRT